MINKSFDFVITLMITGPNWTPLSPITITYKKALAERGAFFRLKVYEREGFHKLKDMKGQGNLCVRGNDVNYKLELKK